MARHLVWVCLALGLFMAAADSCQAQLRFRQFGQFPGRVLGHGNGPGYHRCNPGPDVSYYNSWTRKNSFLISQSPQYLSRFGHETQFTPMQLLYSGQSPYAQRAVPTPSFGGAYGNTTPLNADFVPSTQRRDDDEEDDELDDFDNEDNVGPVDPNVEDRFDDEADAMDDFDDDDDFGGFDSLKEEATEGADKAVDEGASLLEPSVIFLPVSHPRK